MKGLEMARTVRMNHVGQLMPGIFLRGVAPFRYCLMTCMSIRCSWSPMITVRQRRPDESLSSSLSPGRRLAEATGVSSRNKLVAIVDELQRVGLIRSLDVVNVDVQVVGRFQEVIRQHRPLALIQGQVHVGGDQGAAFTLSHGLSHIQRAGGI